jgi:hypothetical protein
MVDICLPPHLKLYLQYDAMVAILLPLVRKEGCACGILEDFANSFTRLRRTFKIVLGSNLLCNGHSLKMTMRTSFYDKETQRKEGTERENLPPLG